MDNYHVIYGKREQAFMKAFYVANGNAVKVDSMEQSRMILDALKDISGISIDIEDFFQRFNSYDDSGLFHIKYMVAGTFCGQTHICVPVDILGKEYLPEKLDAEMGVFSFVYNVDCKEYSQCGYCFFEKNGEFYRRVG